MNSTRHRENPFESLFSACFPISGERGTPAHCGSSGGRRDATWFGYLHSYPHLQVVGLCQILFDNLPYLAPTQTVCNVHRWSSYLLGNSVLLLCIERLGRSKCWDQSLGCPLLLLRSNPQAGLRRTWVPCQCEIAQQRHSQRGRCPFGSAALCRERCIWKKDRRLYSPAAWQCGVEHAADGAVC